MKLYDATNSVLFTCEFDSCVKMMKMCCGKKHIFTISVHGSSSCVSSLLVSHPFFHSLLDKWPYTEMVRSGTDRCQKRENCMNCRTRKL